MMFSSMIRHEYACVMYYRVHHLCLFKSLTTRFICYLQTKLHFKENYEVDEQEYFDLVFILLVPLEILVLLRILSLKVYDYVAITENKNFIGKKFTDCFIVTKEDSEIKIYFKQFCDDFFFVIIAAKDFAIGPEFIVAIFENCLNLSGKFNCP